MYSEMLLEAYLRRLRLPAILKTYKAVARDAEASGYGYTQCLCALLEQEVISREERGIQDRVKKARFPLVKTLDSFDFSAIPTLDKMKVLALSECDFIKAAENVVMIGNSGTGKSHLAIALGHAACKKGYRVRFYNASFLIDELLGAQMNHELARFERQWMRIDLLILDEVGYVPLSADGGQLLFQFLNLRYERRSTVVTTNLEFGNWTKVLGDEQLTAALLDRLTHHCHILLMNADSYRFRQNISARQASLHGIDPKPAAREDADQTTGAKEADSSKATEP